MPAAPFHLAWFLQGSSIQAWGEPWTGSITTDWMSCDMFLDLARGCERACMDYMLLEDSIYVGETWQNSRDIYLKNGMSIPRQEPTVVATLMAADLGVDDRLLAAPNDELGKRALRFLEGKLSDIKAVVPPDRAKKLQAVPIVLDLTHGGLGR